jgi:hypothetical protein
MNYKKEIMVLLMRGSKTSITDEYLDLITNKDLIRFHENRRNIYKISIKNIKLYDHTPFFYIDNELHDIIEEKFSKINFSDNE